MEFSKRSSQTARVQAWFTLNIYQFFILYFHVRIMMP